MTAEKPVVDKIEEGGRGYSENADPKQITHSSDTYFSRLDL